MKFEERIRLRKSNHKINTPQNDQNQMMFYVTHTANTAKECGIRHKNLRSEENG